MRGPFDVIMCRNVMIYFDAPTKKSIVDRCVDLLLRDCEALRTQWATGRTNLGAGAGHAAPPAESAA